MYEFEIYGRIWISRSQRTYSYYESGGHDMPTEILIRIADIYQVSIDYLLERTNKRELNR